MSTHLCRLLAAATLAETLFDALPVTIVGIGIVFVSLRYLSDIFALLHRMFGPGEPANSGEDDAQFAARREGKASTVVDAHLVPILIAAATAALGRRVVLRRVRFINRNTVSGWAEAGRAAIQSSHNIRRNM